MAVKTHLDPWILPGKMFVANCLIAAACKGSCSPHFDQVERQSKNSSLLAWNTITS